MTTVKRAALWALVTALLVLAIEGLASTYVAVSSALESFFRSGERPAQHDPDLGWVNRPGLFNPDLYGPGMWARINSQGFRDDRTVPKAVADGQVRLICSGDSFTFGYGVSNDTTWCHALREIDARIDSVNMGVNGYGVDQAYLRYLRDAKDIEHDVHLFAFIADDFTRMRSGAYRLDSKPTLVVEGGRLSVRGVPVEPPSTASRLLPVLRRAARGLRTGALAQRALPPIGPLGRPTCHWNEPGEPAGPDPVPQVVDKIFESLRDVTAERGSLLVLTYLPCADEYRAPRSSPWRVLARDVAARHGIPLIDLVSDLDNAPREEAETFFIGGLQDERLLSGAGHYTVGGNRFFARALYRRLEAIDAVRAKLSPLGSVDR